MSAIRPILGIAGAAILGSPLNTGCALASAAISPRQDFALAVSVEDHSLRIVRFRNDHPSASPIADGMSSPDHVVFSPSGSAAALYRQDFSRFQILTGLPETPVIREVSTTGRSAPAALAVTDDGGIALLVGRLLVGEEIVGQDPGSSWAVSPDGNFIPLTLPDSTMAVAFRRGSHDLLSATRAGDLYLSQDVDTAPAFRRIFSGDAHASEPVAVRFSSDGAMAYAVGTNGTVIAVELSTGSTQTVSCGCKPLGLDPLLSETMFSLSAISRLPLMLFDASSGLRVWFVPPDPDRTKSPESNQ